MGTLNAEDEFRDDQAMAHWLYGVLLFVLAMVLFGGAVDSEPGEEGGAGTSLVALAPGVLFFLFLFNLLYLRVRVRRGEVMAALGRWVPVLRKRIPLQGIQEMRVVRYRPLRDARGWGMRFGWFEGKYCRFWSAKGNRGVMLDFGDKRYIIGSGAPERLLEALRTASDAGRRDG